MKSPRNSAAVELERSHRYLKMIHLTSVITFTSTDGTNCVCCSVEFSKKIRAIVDTYKPFKNCLRKKERNYNLQQNFSLTVKEF